MERIQINGEWYVKESDITSTEKDQWALTQLRYEGIIWESDKYSFNVTRSDEYLGVIVEFIDKRAGERSKYITEMWDNPEFLIGVLDKDPDCIVFAKETLDDEGIKMMNSITEELLKINWLTR